MKDNKFLTGFLITTFVGAGALGFLLFQAKGKYTEASTAYADKVAELQTLQGGKPYPDEANYKKVLELQKNHQQAIHDLQKQLAAAEIPVEPMTPEKFQDNLREAIKRVRTLAAQKGTQIGDKDGGTDKFSLGFEVYESQPPKPEAAAPLGRMLKAIETVVTEVINSGAVKITADVKRSPLPEEEAGQSKPPVAQPKGGASSKKGQDEAPLVKRYPFDIKFSARETSVRTFINNVVSNKQQFFVPASIRITNQQPAGPSKGGLSAAPDSPAPVAATPADPNAPQPAPTPNTSEVPQAPVAASSTGEALKFVVGEEQLDVEARIEVVDFAEPAPEKSTEKPGKSTSAK